MKWQFISLGALLFIACILLLMSKRNSSIQEMMDTLKDLGYVSIPAQVYHEYLKIINKTKNGKELKRECPDLNSVTKRLENAISSAWKIRGDQDDRRLLSKRLNILSMQLNQLLCDMKNDLTLTGGWCSHHFSTAHYTDNELIKGLAQLLQGKTVGSFGDGPGNYKREILNTGLVQRYDAYDGSPWIENATAGNVSYLELTIPQYGLPVYDWVISVEVVEHIPKEYEDVYLGNLIRHAKIGLIISWARENQGGVGHVNERPIEYVDEKMRSLCLRKDEEATKKLQNSTSYWWLRSNLAVYRRRDDCPVVDANA